MAGNSFHSIVVLSKVLSLSFECFMVHNETLNIKSYLKKSFFYVLSSYKLSFIFIIVRYVVQIIIATYIALLIPRYVGRYSRNSQTHYYAKIL